MYLILISGCDIPGVGVVVPASAVVQQRPVVRLAPGCASRFRVDAASCLLLQVQGDIDQHQAWPAHAYRWSVPADADA
jgi:hypothetical protein